jgi:hypothetical protein
MSPAIQSIRPTLSVQNRAATGGMISSATIRTRPTSFRPITVTARTANIRRRSMRATRYPAAVANSASKATSVIGRRSDPNHRQGEAPPARMTSRVLPQHPRGRAQKKALQPRLPPR